MISQILRYFYLYKDARPLLRYMIHAIADEASNTGKRFMIVRIPTLQDSSRSARAQRALVDVRGIAEEAGAIYLEIPPELFEGTPGWPDAIYLPGDDHLTPRGNRLVAEQIAGSIRELEGAAAATPLTTRGCQSNR